MKIVIADYSGHPFQVQLSRELARRGHSVLHLHFAEFQTPKGRLNMSADDPSTLKIEPVSLGKPFAKQNFIKRRFQEISVGKKFANRVSEFSPDVVVASNFPLDALNIVCNRSQSEGCAFVFWQQDIYSVAIHRILSEKWGLIGVLVGKWYKSIERNVLKRSQVVVAISGDFPLYLKTEFGIASDHIKVLENWAPLDEIVPQSKDNSWSRANALVGKEVVLYTGTLGMKHNPRQLLDLAKALSNRPNTEVVVVSEGPAAEWLAKMADELAVPSLRVMDFQPFEAYSQVLGSADILLSILEQEAGVFSVPSKVLSYLCAERAIVLCGPLENLAARILINSGAGRVVAAGNQQTLEVDIREYLNDKVERDLAATLGRRYAETMFNITSIGDRFEHILLKARQGIERRAR